MLERRIWLHQWLQWHDDTQEQKWEMALTSNLIATFGLQLVFHKKHVYDGTCFGICVGLHRLALMPI